MCLDYIKLYDFWKNLLFPLPSLIAQNEDQGEEGICPLFSGWAENRP